ncbi:MAG: amino acid decarboxylase [Clostridia bacterium]|nr:amino acid decarboxylase [Clostridia bacterium]
MTTPIYDFVHRYKKSGKSRFHMPGHKGRGFINSLDITEINGADVLYHAEGIIAESEANATKLFNTGHTFYSTEGSTLAIKAMLGIIARSRGAGAKILAARNVHKAFVYAVGELDLSVEWIFPRKGGHPCECKIAPEDVRAEIDSAELKPSAVYITSPDYLGNMLDVGGIADVCNEYKIPLLVDNAHGAYLAFCEPNMHPIRLGAAMCADSAHKTLPVLTGGAYLHVAKEYTEYIAMARDTLSLFASTSPSYLTLCSLDLCNLRLSGSFARELTKCKQRVTKIKALLDSLGQRDNADEDIKIRIDAHRFGYTGTEVSQILRKNRVECEYADEGYVVLMASPCNTARDFRRLSRAIEKIANTRRSRIDSDAPSLIAPPSAAMTVREALFAPYESVSVKAAEGRICASPTVSCPPAIPIAVCGELIDAELIKILSYYGIDTVNVVKRD